MKVIFVFYVHTYVQISDLWTYLCSNCVFWYKSFQIQAEFCNYGEIQALKGEIQNFNFKF